MRPTLAERMHPLGEERQCLASLAQILLASAPHALLRQHRRGGARGRGRRAAGWPPRGPAPRLRRRRFFDCPRPARALLAHRQRAHAAARGAGVRRRARGELPKLGAWISGRRADLEVESARMRAAAELKVRPSAGHDGTVTSPMPGKVIKVLVAEGDEVADGAPVVVVEAMKMENELGSPRAGVVQKVHVQPGDAVEGGARLVTVA
ncbi:MAG: acetyl-CoA carboxylase biotin carboxyl carrier protein subunit [Polyangiaceae bacterium]|nr:acetyl-CoA carboxylase biotin carboxyl carrier protein subunit [Polyangiaceae bacterium]